MMFLSFRSFLLILSRTLIISALVIVAVALINEYLGENIGLRYGFGTVGIELPNNIFDSFIVAGIVFFTGLVFGFLAYFQRVIRSIRRELLFLFLYVGIIAVVLYVVFQYL